MKKFIELKDKHDKPFLVQIDHIVAVHPRDDGTSYLELSTDTTIDAPPRIVLISYEKLKTQLRRATE